MKDRSNTKRGGAIQRGGWRPFSRCCGFLFASLLVSLQATGCYTQVRSPLQFPAVEIPVGSPPPPDLEFELTVPETPYDLSGSLIATLSVTNTGSRDFVQTFPSSCQFEIYLYNARGEIVTSPRPCYDEPSTLILAPGETLFVDEWIHEWFPDSITELETGQFKFAVGFHDGIDWIRFVPRRNPWSGSERPLVTYH